MAIQLTTDRRDNAGSCNFCQRGVSNVEQTNLVFPYSHVAVLESDLSRGTGSMRLCPQCVADLLAQLQTFTLPNVAPPLPTAEDYAAAEAVGKKKRAKK